MVNSLAIKINDKIIPILPVAKFDPVLYTSTGLCLSLITLLSAMRQLKSAILLLNLLKTVNGMSGTDQAVITLGSLCISLVDKTDPDFKEFSDVTLLSNSIVVFNGCKNCNDKCELLLQIKRQIRDLHLWFTLLKDCILYNLNDARNLYLTVLNKAFKQLSNPVNCTLDSNPQTRTSLFYGLQLLQQYKTVVAMWNYLASKRSVVYSITTAALDFSGMDITIKKSINLCLLPLLSGLRIKLVINVRPMANSEQPLLEASDNIVLLVLCNTVNTYMELGTNFQHKTANRLLYPYYTKGSYSLSKLGTLTVNLLATTDKVVYPGTLLPVAKPLATALFLYAPTKQTNIVCSGSVKIIPLYVLKRDMPQGMLSLLLYTEIRLNNVAISTQDQYKKVQWEVKYSWYFGDVLLSLDSLYYATPYTRYPKSRGD